MLNAGHIIQMSVWPHSTNSDHICGNLCSDLEKNRANELMNIHELCFAHHPTRFVSAVRPKCLYSGVL